MNFLSTGLTVLMCVGFVLLGRWLYRNPQRVFPKWGLLNPEHPRTQKLGRMYAAFFIFIGTLASMEVAFAYLFPSVPGMTFFAIPVGVGIAWYLRPKIDPSAPLADAPTVQPQKQQFLSKHWKATLAIAASVGAVLMVSIFWGIGNSDACKLAVAAAQANPIVRQRLGEPIKRGFFISGNVEVSGPSGKADIEVPIRGPRGKATLYVVAEKSSGLWKLESLEVGYGDETARTNLLVEGTNSSEP